jgi:hypothetical protein
LELPPKSEGIESEDGMECLIQLPSFPPQALLSNTEVSEAKPLTLLHCNKENIIVDCRSLACPKFQQTYYLTYQLSYTSNQLA